MSKQDDLSKGIEKTIKLCMAEGFTDAEIAREVLNYEAKNNVVIRVDKELPVEIKGTITSSGIELLTEKFRDLLLKDGYVTVEPLIEEKL